MYNLGDPADSWYEATVKRENFLRLKKSQNLKADVCVIGGGFTGLSAALELALQGRKVVLLEAREVGFGASGRNGGQVIGGFHHEYHAIGKQFGEDVKKACYDISEAGKELLESRIKKYKIDCHLHWGYTHLAIKPKHLRQMETELTDWQSLGYNKGKLLSLEEVKAKIHSDFYMGGLHDSYSGHMHPLRYLLGLAKACKSAGVKIYEKAQATSVDCDKGIVQVGENIVNCDNIIIAGNAYIHLHPLLPKLYKRIMPVVSNIGATRVLTAAEQQEVIKDKDAYVDYNFIVDYYRMSHDNRLLFGGRASYGNYEPKDMRQWMQKRMGRVFPNLRHMELDFIWGGKIGITTSRYPDIGRIGKRGFYAQGYCGHGVLLSNICGKILAEAVCGTQDRFDVLSGFKQGNFPGGFLRRPALMLGMLFYRLQDAL